MDEDSDRCTPISYEADEIINNVAAVNANQIINGEIQFHGNNEEPVQFGQTTPWARQNSVFKVTIFYIYSSSLTEKKTQSKPIVQEDEDTCECSTDIFEKKFGVYNDEQIFSLLINHESNVDNMFIEMNLKESVDNSTCLLYDVFSYLTTKLCCFTNMILNHSQSNQP